MTDSKFKEGAPDTTSSEARGRGQGTYTSDTSTRGIRIQVKSTYLSDRSSPRDSQYLFAYNVRISNVGTDTAQLVSRATDGQGVLQQEAFSLAQPDGGAGWHHITVTGA